MLLQRKNIRLPFYNYSTPGAYFVTIATKDKREILSEIIVGTVEDAGPEVKLTDYGRIAEKYLQQMNEFYTHIDIDNYVIMPNHIHFLLVIKSEENQLEYKSEFCKVNNVNSEVSKFVSTFKRFCNKEYGENIWQSRSYDHVIRGDRDYREIYEYISNNPGRWVEDKFYQGEKCE